MATIPMKVKDRLAAGIKRYLPVLTSAKSRDVNESDTVTIITDMLAEIFGFDKYSEITFEYVIRSTYVDLATRLDGKLQMLQEAQRKIAQAASRAIRQAMKSSLTKPATPNEAENTPEMESIPLMTLHGLLERTIT